MYPHLSFPIRALLAIAALLSLLAGCKGEAAPPPDSAEKGDIVVTVEDLQGTDGHLIVWLYHSEEHFPQDTENAYRTAKVKVTGSTMQVVFEGVPHHSYAMVFLHDEDDDGSMSFGITGPQEGHGVSRDASTLIGPPPFEDAAFELKEARLELSVHMDY